MKFVWLALLLLSQYTTAYVLKNEEAVRWMRESEKEDVVPGNPPTEWRQYSDGFVKKFLVRDECEEIGKCPKNS